MGTHHLEEDLKAFLRGETILCKKNQFAYCRFHFCFDVDAIIEDV